MSSEIQKKIYLLALLKKLRRETARKDIQYFAKYYLPHYVENEIPDFHKEIYSLIRTENRLGIAAPRGFAKSTIVQVIYGLHRLLFNEGEDILIISASASLAEEFISKIKGELDGNDRIREDFGGLMEWGEKVSKRWTGDHLVLMAGNKLFSQVRAKGRGCQIRGFRPTTVVIDDLEDDELVRSDEQRRLLQKWFLGALLNVLKNDQQLIVIGTILHPVALLAKIIRRDDEFKNWKTVKFKALTNGKSIWEDRFTTDDLLQRKFEIGTYAFEAEFQNNPISSDICLWRPDWLVKYDELPPGVEIVEKFIAVDPAISTRESADYTGIVVWGVGNDSKVYELESIKGRWGTWDLIDRLVVIYAKYEPLKIGIEKEKLEVVLKPILLSRAKSKLGVPMRFTSIQFGQYKPGEKRVSRDKYSRALTVIHYFEQDMVRLKSQELIDQLSLFPTGSGDDLVDAAVHGLHLIQRHSSRASIFRQAERKKRGMSSFEITDGTMPAMVPPEEFFGGGLKDDWRLNG